MLKISAVYFMLNPEIWQEPPTCGQDDLVLLMLKDRIETLKVYPNHFLCTPLWVQPPRCGAVHLSCQVNQEK